MGASALVRLILVRIFELTVEDPCPLFFCLTVALLTFIARSLFTVDIDASIPRAEENPGETE